MPIIAEAPQNKTVEICTRGPGGTPLPAPLRLAPLARGAAIRKDSRGEPVTFCLPAGRQAYFLVIQKVRIHIFELLYFSGKYG